MLLYFFFQAEDGIRDLVRSRGLGDVYKRQVGHQFAEPLQQNRVLILVIVLDDIFLILTTLGHGPVSYTHLTLPTSDLV